MGHKKKKVIDDFFQLNNNEKIITIPTQKYAYG